MRELKNVVEQTAMANPTKLWIDRRTWNELNENCRKSAKGVARPHTVWMYQGMWWPLANHMVTLKWNYTTVAVRCDWANQRTNWFRQKCSFCMFAVRFYRHSKRHLVRSVRKLIARNWALHFKLVNHISRDVDGVGHLNLGVSSEHLIPRCVQLIWMYTRRNTRDRLNGFHGKCYWMCQQFTCARILAFIRPR